MNKEGVHTALKVAEKYFGILLTEKWINDHIDRINTFFPQDRGYAFTFQGECERNTLSDTLPRGAFMDAIAYVLTGRTWPILCDQSQFDEFFKEFKNSISIDNDISLISGIA